MVNQYETVFIMTPVLSEDQMKETVKKYQSLLKEKGAETKVAHIQAYINNLQKYLSTGEYVDLFYGEYQQHKVRYRCVVPAYYKDGTPKYSYGVFYQDLGYTYTGLDPEVEEA